MGNRREPASRQQRPRPALRFCLEIQPAGPLTLNPGVANGDTVTVSYTAGADPIQDIAENDAGNLVDQGVMNNTPAPDTTAPTLVSATVDSTSLVLTYDEELDTGSVPATADFSIGTNGEDQSVTVVEMSGTAVTLTLNPGVANGDTVTVTYTAGANPIQDIAENDAGNLVDQGVMNNTPAPGGTVSVASITFATEGGKDGKKHLMVTIALVDYLNNPVSGASVSNDLFRDASFVGSATGTTDGSGEAHFTMKNAPPGCYHVEVTNVTADGLNWDPNDPANTSADFCK